MACIVARSASLRAAVDASAKTLPTVAKAVATASTRPADIIFLKVNRFCHRNVLRQPQAWTPMGNTSNSVNDSH
jgi:hypothetical protein